MYKIKLKKKMLHIQYENKYRRKVETWIKNKLKIIHMIIITTNEKLSQLKFQNKIMWTNNKMYIFDTSDSWKKLKNQSYKTYIIWNRKMDELKFKFRRI